MTQGGHVSSKGWRRVRLLLGAATLGLWTTPTAALAQRATDSVVRNADDAFGTSVGNERFGLYSDDNVRGFSPAVAGNVRIEGLYFDRRTPLSTRLVRNSRVRVGLSAQGYLFPAPSGIVDYALRSPEGPASATVQFGIDSWGRRAVEIDADAPVAERVSLAGGVAAILESSAPGVDRGVVSGAAVLRATPADQVRITMFTSAFRVSGEEAPPTVFTATAALPPLRPSRRFYGQSWSDTTTLAVNHGLLATGRLGSGVTLEAGLFYSRLTYRHSHSDLFIGADAEGLAEHVLLAFPSQDYSALSGEIRIERRFSEGPRRHALTLSARGRRRGSDYGGGAAFDAGPARIGEAVEIPRPAFRTGLQTHEQMEQRSLGLSYLGVWPDVGEAGVGLQRTDYRRRLKLPGAASQTVDQPRWLWNAGGALYVSRKVTLFGSLSRGLEDSGTAPQNAANANAALPANISRQVDVGVRLISGRSRLVAALYRIEKPYYALDTANVYSPLGRLRSRGLETSLTTEPFEGLRLVGGLLLARPRVTVGGRTLVPLGFVERQVRVAAEYTPPGDPRWSFDAAVTHYGKRAARSEAGLFTPSFTLVDAGARRRLTIGGVDVTARFFVSNLFDKRTWAVTPGSGFLPDPPRRFVLNIYREF